jgi:hypothetical protein
MTEKLRWYPIDRQELPGVVAERQLPQHLGGIAFPSIDTHDLLIGVVSDEGESRPVLAVLKQDKARELLAWLATYSPPSFPVSQSLRVISAGDLDSAAFNQSIHSSQSADLNIWACIVLGELLALGEQGTNIDAVAVSRAVSCYSFTKAKTDSSFGASSPLASQCIRRLRSLADDKIIGRRPVNVNDLLPIWGWAHAQQPNDSLQRDALQVVEDAVSGHLGDQLTTGEILRSIGGFDAVSLSTGTIEARVRAYQAVSRSLEGKAVADSSAVAMLLAAAAICVGNGTSHVSLLEETARKHPTAYVWFGLFAALSGSVGWDPSWNRAINSLCRVLRGRLNFSEPSICDISWIEYEFLRELPKPIEFLKHIPRLTSKSLAIEVVPGSVCQLRLKEEHSAVRSVGSQVDEPELRNYSTPDPVRERLLAQMLESLYEAERALDRSHSILRDAIGVSGTLLAKQSSLFAENPNRTGKKRGHRKNEDPD